MVFFLYTQAFISLGLVSSLYVFEEVSHVFIWSTYSKNSNIMESILNIFVDLKL